MTDKPGLHPLPPVDFHARTLTMRRFPGVTVWYRFHNKNHSALHFGKQLSHRFDDPEQRFGVLYVARHREGAFAEVFLRNIEPYRFVTTDVLENKVLSMITMDRSLKLVDLAGIGLARMGIDSRLATGSYAVSQCWSHAFQKHPQTPDGILYRSRHYPRHLCAAIFETSQVVFKEKLFGTLWEYLGEDKTYALLAKYRLGLL